MSLWSMCFTHKRALTRALVRLRSARIQHSTIDFRLLTPLLTARVISTYLNTFALSSQDLSNMRAFSTSTLVFGLLANIVTAVTPIPVSNGCASYPGYSSATEPTDPFIVEAIHNGSPIEGHGLTYVLFQPEKYNGAIGRVNLSVTPSHPSSPIQIPPNLSSLPSA